MKHFYLLLAAVFFSISSVVKAQNFYLAPNGVTCMCPNAAVGDTGVVNGVTYTKRTKAQITPQNAATTCTSGITNMVSLFYNEVSFNGNISSWDTSNVTDMNSMFMGAISFDQPLNNWDVSNVIDMGAMFRETNSFNQPLANWDVSNVKSMSGMFENANSFNQSLASWDVSNVTTMVGMFEGAASFNQSINNWNVSKVKNMNRMFYKANSFNQPLNNWNVSNVIGMYNMFTDAQTFNQPLHNWDVSNVTDMIGMFGNATSFNQNLNSWNVSNVIKMSAMFYGATSFNQPLNNWDVSNVTKMRHMFYNAQSFNQSLDSWNVSNVSDMSWMFSHASSFNQPLDDWDVSNVTDMSRMFLFMPNANPPSTFNQPLNNWDVSNVTDMNNMFSGAVVFNHPLNNWDVSNVSHMVSMFRDAHSFNQPLNNWDVSNVPSLGGMFYNAHSFNQNLSNWHINSGVLGSFLSNSGMDISNYDAFLTHLATLGFNNGNLGADNLEYCNGSTRGYLINQLGWTLNGDNFSPDCNYIQGTMLFDKNNNGCDLNDIEANGFMINATDGANEFSTISLDGAYKLGVIGTSFTVSVANVPSYFNISPVSSNVTFSGSNTEVLDFCVTANQTIEDLNITLLPTSEARPGFEADYRLVVKNVGTETIANGVATFEFDDTMQKFVSANPAPGTTATNTLTFPIGTMQPFQKFEADITMFTFQPPTVEGGDILNFIAEVTPNGNDHTPNDNIYNLAQVVVNSYDPNDKQVLQGEEVHIDDANKYLDYLIRFQNMGTASAINVRILDTLHDKLDWSTFTPINASHDYYIKITEGNRVEFMFDNIDLPHEDDDEPASHGFVAYKIKPKSNVQVGDVISGDAAIYFDFNPPIITNMVHTQIVNPLSLADNPNPLNNITVYPNPTNKTLHIFLTDNIQLEEVTIYDLQGKEVQNFQGKEKTLNVENLSRGMYFLKITTDRGVVNRKFVKN